jgi:hypothetical protein
MDPNKNPGANADTPDPNAALQDAATVDAGNDTTDNGLDGALAALDAGLEQAGEAPADDGATDDEGGQPGEGETDAAAGKEVGADPAKDAAADAGQGKDKPAESADKPVKSAEEEATELGVKNERARARFLELRTQADKVPELEKQAQSLKARAERGEQIVQSFEETGAQPKQVTSVLAYLHAVNKGDLAAMTNAYEVMEKELDWLADKLGKPRRGQDLLADHADLREAVEDGMPRAQAEELAARRNEDTAQRRHREQQARVQSEQNAEQAQFQEQVTEAMDGLNLLEARLKAEDPTNYQARMDAVLAGHRERIQQLPPSRWVVETELAYLKTAAPAPQAPAGTRRPAVGHVPIRQAGGGSGMGRVASSAEDALELGLAAAARGITA